MDDRVVVSGETTVSGGQRMRVDCEAPKGGVFFCTHDRLDFYPRVLSGGKCSLTAVCRPGVESVRLLVGEPVGVVFVNSFELRTAIDSPTPERQEVSGNGGKKQKRG